MIKENYDKTCHYLKIKSKAKELETYSGYLPWIIQREIDLENYFNFLEKKGLYDKFKDRLSETRTASYQKHKEEFLQWISHNPEYQEFLIEE